MIFYSGLNSNKQSMGCEAQIAAQLR